MRLPVVERSSKKMSVQKKIIRDMTQKVMADSFLNGGVNFHR